MSRFRNIFGSARNTPLGPISGNDDIDPYRAEDVIHLKHGANEYLFKYPANTIRKHEVNIGHVRDKAAEITGVPRKRLTLVCKGVKLKDDAQTLKAAGIEHNGTIMAIGNSAGPIKPPAEQQQQKAPVKKVLSPMERIEEMRETFVRDLKPKVDKFCESPPETKEQGEDMHRRLSETIMGQCLLKLDGVESTEPEVRARRKEVIREVQGALDQLDKVLRETY